MPLTDKGSQILSAMEQEYGEEKGKSVFYASKNAGTISGVDAFCDAVNALAARADAMEKGYVGSVGGVEGGVPVKVKAES